MRSRFFGASSYDDDDDDEEEMDLSGFVTSSETQPVVVERKRAPRTSPSQSDQMFGRSGATNASNMGNAGPKTNPPPPMSNMGRMYTATYEESPGGNAGGWGAHIKPLYASDMSSDATAKTAVIMKVTGLSVVVLGITTQLATKYKKLGATMAVVGAASYVHPVLGIRHGMLAELAGNKSPTFTTMAALSTNVAGAGVFAKGLNKVTDGKFPEVAQWRTIAGAGVVGVLGLGAVRQFR